MDWRKSPSWMRPVRPATTKRTGQGEMAGEGSAHADRRSRSPRYAKRMTIAHAAISKKTVFGNAVTDAEVADVTFMPVGSYGQTPSTRKREKNGSARVRVRLS